MKNPPTVGPTREFVENRVLSNAERVALGDVRRSLTSRLGILASRCPMPGLTPMTLGDARDDTGTTAPASVAVHQLLRASGLTTIE